jgi:hypothetical protein
VPDAPIPTAPKACTTWSCPIYIPTPLFPAMCKFTCAVVRWLSVNNNTILKKIFLDRGENEVELFWNEDEYIVFEEVKLLIFKN